MFHIEFYELSLKMNFMNYYIYLFVCCVVVSRPDGAG